MITRCTFEMCHRTTVRPIASGWALLVDWGSGIKDGYYCLQHAAALEALHVSGELDADLADEEPSNDEETGERH
jgi:hypothetical protein